MDKEDQDLIIALYDDPRFSPQNIADKFECSVQKISWIFRKYRPSGSDWHKFRKRVLTQRLREYENRNGQDPAAPLDLALHPAYKKYKLAKKFLECGLDYDVMRKETGLTQKQITVQIMSYLPGDVARETFYRSQVVKNYKERNK